MYQHNHYNLKITCMLCSAIMYNLVVLFINYFQWITTLYLTSDTKQNEISLLNIIMRK